MIVQCDRCQTRFRLPDGAVGHRGAKARCSRCGNVFIVEKPDAPESQATVPPPSGYAGFTAGSGALPEVTAPAMTQEAADLLTDGPPTSRTDVPSFLNPSKGPPTLERPAARPPPPAALGAFAPSSPGGRRPEPASLPPPPVAPETSTPEQALDQFFNIPPPLSSPPVASSEVAAFSGPAFGRTEEVSKFSRASFVSFPPPPAHDSIGPPAAPTSDSAEAIPNAPGLGGAFDLPSWGVQDKETARMEPSEIPDLDSLPEVPEARPDTRDPKDTSEGDAFQLESALELSRARSDAPAPRPPQRAKSSGVTRRVDVGGLDFIAPSSKSIESPPLEPKELPAWVVEVAALVIAGLVATPFIMALEDPSSALRPVMAFLTSAPGPIDAQALSSAVTEDVRVQALIGTERGVIVRGRVRNAGETPLTDTDVVVHALDGERVVETQRQALSGSVLPDKPLDFAVIFPSAEIDYRPLRFRVEVAPQKAGSATADDAKNP